VALTSKISDRFIDRAQSMARILVIDDQPQIRGLFREALEDYGHRVAGKGWWHLIPIWEPDVTPNPLRRWEPPVPYWARDP
jgi:hypothetical protein